MRKCKKHLQHYSKFRGLVKLNNIPINSCCKICKINQLYSVSCNFLKYTDMSIQEI